MLDTDSLRPRRAPDPAAPLPSCAPSLHSSRGARAAPPPTAALLTRCALGRRSCGSSASSTPQPAGSGFPLLARGSAPGVFPSPALRGTPLPRMPPDSSPGGGQRARELGAPTQQSLKEGLWGGAGGQGMRGGADAGRREEECGEGAGETSRLRYANSREDGVGPLATPHPKPAQPSGGR